MVGEPKGQGRGSLKPVWFAKNPKLVAKGLAPILLSSHNRGGTLKPIEIIKTWHDEKRASLRKTLMKATKSASTDGKS